MERVQPEERLWAAVILQAVQDMDSQSLTEARRAKFWLFDDTRREVGSLHWITKHLGINRDALLTACLTLEGRKRMFGGFTKREEAQSDELLLDEFGRQDRRRGGHRRRRAVDAKPVESEAVSVGASSVRLGESVSGERNRDDSAGGAP